MPDQPGDGGAPFGAAPGGPGRAGDGGADPQPIQPPALTLPRGGGAIRGIGETFRASIDEPVVVGSDQVIPRGSDVVVKLVDDKQAGKISGRTELTLDLVSVTVNGKTVDVNTQSVTQQSASRTGRSEKVIGGTAALGAIIGALAGGGKGAAIGAVSGAGAGTAVQVLTKGQQVKIPSETRLAFTLQYPVRI